MGVRRLVLGLLAALAALSLGSCGGTGGSGESEAGGGGPRTDVERLAGERPETLLAAVRRVVELEGMRAEVSPTDGDPYTWVAQGEAWRVAAPAQLLVVGDQLCFDRGFRPDLETAVGTSYGAVEFDPRPWSCTPTDFGLNQLLAQRFARLDPRTRLEHLTTDDPQVWSAEVEEVDGESLLHVRTTGVTADGPLDPSRPFQDLWVDADHRPVRLAAEGTTWEFARPEGLAAQLTLPPAGERGSYGYVVGPGQGVAKACQQSGTCSRETFRGPLTWGDGRTP